MCLKNKLVCITRGDNAWRIPMSSGVLGFVLGMSCFGIAMKLSEYKDSPTLAPLLAGIPMLGAGIAGMVGGRMRKQWLISLHTVLCLIASVLSLHLMFLFLGREAKSRERYRAKCQSNFKGEFFCHRYAVTIAMSALSVLAVTLAPLGILSCVVIRRTSAYNVNEVQEVNNPHFQRHSDPESAPRPQRTDDRHPPPRAKQEAKKACDRPQTNHAITSKARPQRQHHQPNYHNYHGNPRVPSRGAQMPAPNTKHPDHSRHNRKLYQQRNLQRIIAAQNSSWQQSHIPPGQRLQRGLSNTTDTSFA